MRCLLPVTLVLTFAAAPAAAGGPLFDEIAREVGLAFVHFNGMTGKYYFPEMTGQGGGVIDYDQDGDLDVYLVQGAMLGPEEKLADALFPLQGDPPPRDRLFRNELEKGSLRFVEVTDQAKLRATGYGMGVATGDYDNDGFVDLYLTNYGPNQLWHNRGDGTFEDVTAATGTGDDRWGSSAAFADFDRDGWLDLYVANYVVFDVAKNPICYASSSRPDYCGPSSFPPQPDRLYRNRGRGDGGEVTFEDVTTRWLAGYEAGPGLGVVSGDFNGDGWTDLYVANDGAANQLWVRSGGDRFELVDDALLAGVAVNRRGEPEASMGIGAGDFDGDGDEDLVVAHLMGETNTLYTNDGTGLFEDRSTETGVGSPSFSVTAFGAGFFDYDNDGWLDLLTVTGAVRILEDRVDAGDKYPLDQRNQLFRNLGPAANGGAGGVRFEDVSDRAGTVFALAEVSRGAVFGDLDNDGDTDVIVTNSNGPVRLLRNRVGQDAPWVGLRLVGRDGRRDMYGARVTVTRGGRSLTRFVRTDGSYASANDPRVLVGVGSGGAVAVRVRWPDGSTESWKNVPAGTYTTLRQGSGETPK